VPPGEKQIDRRLLEITMTQQHLDGAQVGAGFNAHDRNYEIGIEPAGLPSALRTA